MRDLETTIEGRATAAPDDALAVIDQYHLLRELGGGGFGTVYLAKDDTSGVLVAVKGLPPLVRNSREELENIRANFALVTRLTHENIAKALVLHPAKNVRYANARTKDRLRVEPGDTLMVMDYAPGVTLSEWRTRHPGGVLPFDEAADILAQIAAALDYAHAQKIVHRDIKPSNVMVEETPGGGVSVRVLDFGLAAEIRSSMGRVSLSSSDTSGTRPYMAPEQWQGRRQGAATDQYALAALACELLTGEIPFKSAFDTGSVAVMRAAVVNEPADIGDDLPPRAAKALKKALAKRPDDRFATCSDFVAALRGAVPCLHRRPFARRTLVLGGAAAVIVAALFGAGRHRPSQTPAPSAAPPAPAAEGSLKSEVLLLKEKARQAHDANAPDDWQGWPAIARRAKEIEACYRAGVKAFDGGDYAGAKKMFLRLRDTMYWLDAAKERRARAVAARTDADARRTVARNSRAERLDARAWNAASGVFADADARFKDGAFEEADARYRDAAAAFAALCKKIWRPGMDCPGWPHVKAAEEPGRWTPEKGYRWVDRDAYPDDLTVEWKKHWVSGDLRTSDREGVWQIRCGICNGTGRDTCAVCKSTGGTPCGVCTQGYIRKSETTVCDKCTGGVRRERCAYHCQQGVDRNWYIRCDFTDCTWMPNGAHVRQMGQNLQACEKCRGLGVILCPHKEHDDNGVIPVICSVCKGNGTISRQIRTTCPNCDGTARTDCRTCRGQRTVRCKNCGGGGWIDRTNTANGR